MTITWSSLSAPVRAALEARGLGPGTLVYIRKTTSPDRAQLTREYEELRSSGLSVACTVRELADRFERDPKTIRHYLRLAGVCGGTR